MSGYDRKRFALCSAKELDDFTCGICHGIFNKPVVTDCCQQTYCSECINQWLYSKTTCPNDRKQLNKKDLRTPPKVLVNLLGNLKITCEYQTEGCLTLVEMENIEIHLKKCDFRPNSLCKVCSQIRKSVSKHNCVETLLAEIKKINAEKEKINSEKKEIQNRWKSDLKYFDECLTKLSEDNEIFMKSVAFKIEKFEKDLLSSHEQNFGKFNEFRDKLKLKLKEADDFGQLEQDAITKQFQKIMDFKSNERTSFSGQRSSSRPLPPPLFFRRELQN